MGYWSHEDLRRLLLEGAGKVRGGVYEPCGMEKPWVPLLSASNSSLEVLAVYAVTPEDTSA